MASSGTFADHYVLGDLIGKGAYAVVHECVHRRSGRRCAVKVVDKSIAGAKDVDDLAHEITVMRKVGYHPHVLRMLDHYDTPSHLYIVLDLLRGGMLFDRLVEVKHYSERSAAAVVWRLLSALQHIHSRGICHRDLKPENLLLRDVEPHSNGSAEAARDGGNGHGSGGAAGGGGGDAAASHATTAHDMPFLTDVCIADFGLAGYVPCTTCCGSPAYIAPEVICVGYYGTQRTPYDSKCDIWSLGVIAYILLSGKMPFYGSNFRQTFSRIVSNEWSTSAPVWREVSARAVAFVQACLTPDPAQRPSAAELLQHPWLLEQPVDTHLQHSLEALRQFTARQKVRAAVRVFCATHKLLGGAALDHTPPFMRYLRHEDKYTTVVLHQSQTHSDVMHRVDFGVALQRDGNNGSSAATTSATGVQGWRLQQCCTCGSAFVCRHIQNVHEYLFVGCRAMDVFPFVDELNMMRQEAEDELASNSHDAEAVRRLQQVQHALRAAAAFAEELAKLPRDQLKPNLMLGDGHAAVTLLSRLQGGAHTKDETGDNHANSCHSNAAGTAKTSAVAHKLATAALRAKTTAAAAASGAGANDQTQQQQQQHKAGNTAAATRAGNAPTQRAVMPANATKGGGTSPRTTSSPASSKATTTQNDDNTAQRGGGAAIPAERAKGVCNTCSIC